MAADHLAEYRRKRDFARTPEPAPAPPAPGAAAGGRFVVQRHRARRLHYDVRLEIDGVLVSWAVPKGPSLDPKARRLAARTEDHPMEYYDFEGVIPAGEYGGGDVIVWDWGTWSSPKTDDPRAAVDAGELHADLQGEKLHGRFVFVRTGTERGREQWLLFHKRDEFAVAGWDAENHPRSVRSGRTNDEVKASPEAQWRSDAPAASVALDVSRMRADLAALDQLGPNGGLWAFDGVTLKLSNLDKVLFPPAAGTDEPPLTKRDLIRWYASVAPVLLPYLRGRAVNLHRYPNGVAAKGFWHKELPSHAPVWVDRWHHQEADDDETQCYVVAERPATLAWLANFGAVELHAWTSRTESPDRPTYALVDIDPGTATGWEDTLVLARLYRTALDHLGVRGYPKVTGRRGVQIWVPIEPTLDFAETRRWVETLSRTVGRVVPDLVSWRWEVEARGGRARLDFTQNAVNKTLVAPYSVRAAAGAPVSMPIRWDELDDPDLRPDRWTIRTAPARLAEVGDLWTPMLTDRQRLVEL